MEYPLGQYAGMQERNVWQVEALRANNKPDDDMDDEETGVVCVVPFALVSLGGSGGGGGCYKTSNNV